MKMIKVGAVVAGVTVIALTVSYFLLLGPKATAVEFELADESISSTVPQMARGSVSPAEAGRLVIVQVRGEGGSGWDEAARTSTDETGVYKVEFPMAARGDYEVRVLVEQEGRQRSVTSDAEAVRVLSPTQVQAEIPRFARTDRPMRISGRVGPAAKRRVTVESSVDGLEWATVGSGSSQPNGKFSIRADGFAPGEVQLRVGVVESETEAATETEAQKVNVEDYKTAGRKYLRIVEPVNKLLDPFNDAGEAGDLGQLQAVAARLARASTKQAREFRNYAYWPREVRRELGLLQKASTLDADYFNQVANAETLAEAYAIDYPSGPAGADEAPVVVRAALGLPKRD